jgi:heme a synthase
LVFAMVMVGGATRLTGSGLSIVEWKPVTGALPPMSQAAWLQEFQLYKQIPEAQTVHFGMTLEEFKQIYFWEYLHRLWGRLIGIAFALPLVWFLVTRRLPAGFGPRLGWIFALGALQGGVGWWMVASGLVDRTDVSQYRLVAHLGLALVIYVAVVWTVLDLLAPSAPGAAPGGLRRTTTGLVALVFLTVLSGGFVAGLDAGLTYNTFPLMDGRLFPAGYFLQQPWWLNWFENVTAVQFNHRFLAVATLVSSLTLCACWRGRVAPPLRLSLYLLAGATLLQVALGIATLLLVVPIPLAALHQAGAVLVLTAAVVLRHTARGVPVRALHPARA